MKTAILVHIGPERRSTRFFSDEAAAAVPDGVLVVAAEDFDFSPLDGLRGAHGRADLDPSLEEEICDAAGAFLGENVNAAIGALGTIDDQLKFSMYFTNASASAIEDALRAGGYAFEVEPPRWPVSFDGQISVVRAFNLSGPGYLTFVPPGRYRLGVTYRWPELWRLRNGFVSVGGRTSMSSVASTSRRISPRRRPPTSCSARRPAFSCRSGIKCCRWVWRATTSPTRGIGDTPACCATSATSRAGSSACG